MPVPSPLRPVELDAARNVPGWIGRSLDCRAAGVRLSPRGNLVAVIHSRLRVFSFAHDLPLSLGFFAAGVCRHTLLRVVVERSASQRSLIGDRLTFCIVRMQSSALFLVSASRPFLPPLCFRTPKRFRCSARAHRDSHLFVRSAYPAASAYVATSALPCPLLHQCVGPMRFIPDGFDPLDPRHGQHLPAG